MQTKLFLLILSIVCQIYQRTLEPIDHSSTGDFFTSVSLVQWLQ